MEGVYHEPVLLREAIEALSIHPAGIYVDATLGGGGYAEAIAQKLTTGTVFAFDTDLHALAYAAKRLRPFGARVVIVAANFRNLQEALGKHGIEMIDGIVYDLGVSSHQLDTTSIGLSYRVDAPLDMRLDPTIGTTARDIVNTASAQELANIFRTYGEEPLSGRIARRIVEARSAKSIETTQELAEIISIGIREDKRNAVRSRIFQALRIAVNDELESLSASLAQAVAMTRTGGRIVVISYHSLEDRIVKDLFRRESTPRTEEGTLKSLKATVDLDRARLSVVTKKTIIAGEEEQRKNPRSRSAKMRVAQKL
jgi:16S rRNA (cytosine1402-N4)-methyltransferase